MHRIPIFFTFWPGLPQLWLHGRWSGLLKAGAFAAFFNFVLLASYGQQDLLPKAGLIGCWMVMGLVWIVSIIHNDGLVKEFDRQQSLRKQSSELDELFQLAQSEYLQGHLDEAENLFERILMLEPKDIEARLYLATINRHRGRLHQASRQLDTMEQDRQVEQWRFQIEDERKLIAKLEAELDPTAEERDSVKLSDGLTDGEARGLNSLTSGPLDDDRELRAESRPQSGRAVA